MYVIENQDTRPQYNLALEERLCRMAADEGAEFFMLWQNEPSIIVGRFQNTMAEINADFVRERGIHVVRRNSGGGAVYHDLGNVNYSFISADRGEFDFAFFTTPILRAMAAMGVKAELSGRNDVTIGGRKISGGAEWRFRGLVLHHGTLLFDSDMEVLAQALNVDPEKVRSKGIASVRSRVTNIRPCLPPDGPATAREFMAAITRRIEGLTPRELTEADRAEVRRLMDEKYSTWDWNFGASPPFTIRRKMRFRWGSVEALLSVERGAITGCSFYGDFFGSGDTAPLLSRLRGAPYTQEGVREALTDYDPGTAFSGANAADMEALLLPEI